MLERARGYRKKKGLYINKESDLTQLLNPESVAEANVVWIGGHGFEGNPSSIDLSPLATYEQLEVVKITDLTSLEKIDLSWVESLSALKEIVLRDLPKLSSVDLSPLFHCSSIESVHIGDCGIQGVLDLRPLGNKDRLRDVFIDTCPIEEILMDDVTCSSHLGISRLYISHTRIREIDFSSNNGFFSVSLESHHTLKRVVAPSNTSSLDVRFNNSLENNVELVDLSPLANSELLSLSLDENGLSTIDLSPIASCKNLKRVDLGKNNLESIDLTALSECTKLRYLNLGKNPMKRVDVTPLFSCKELETFLPMGDDIIPDADHPMIYLSDKNTPPEEGTFFHNRRAILNWPEENSENY